MADNINKNFLLHIDIDDVKDFLQEEGFNVKQRGKWLYTNSPFYKDSKQRCCFAYSEQHGTVVFTDFIARAKIDDEIYRGSFWKFLALHKELGSISDAKIWFLTNVKKLKLTNDKSKKPVEIKKPEKLEFPDRFEKFDKKLHEPYYHYMINRWVTPEKIDSLKLFVDPKYKRLIFPIYENNELINYTSRAIDENPMRWQKSSVKGVYPIWNLENVNEVCWIFEGIFDALRVTNGVAILGASLNEEMLNKICNKNFYKIVVVMDNDEAGRKAREQICYLLAERLQKVFIYNWKGIKEKDFSEIPEIDLSRVLPWDFTTQLKFKMELVI